MNETLMQEILKRLDLISEKLGEGGAFAWETFIRQALWVDGVLRVGFAVASIVLAIVLVCLGARVWKTVVNHYESDADAFFDTPLPAIVGIVLVVLVIILTVSAFSSLTSGLEHMANPAYYALMDLARSVGR